jgi:hypothetical protein
MSTHVNQHLHATMSDPLEPRVDRSAFSAGSSFDDEDERAYWHARTPAERLRHMEFLRRINYGSRATEKMEKVLEVVRVTWR